MKALVTGSNRGIGLEFCRQLMARGDEVIGVCRSASPELQASGARVIEGVDVTSEEGRQQLARTLSGDTIDLLINNAGIMESVTLGNLDAESIRRQFEVNALAPLLVTEALLPRLADSARVCIVTSRMGSIADNDSGDSYGYRMSKTAANMAGRSLAIDLKDRGVVVALLHPGWVRTGMTGHNGLIDADESVRGLIGVIDRLDVENTGRFWHTNGEILPW